MPNFRKTAGNIASFTAGKAKSLAVFAARKTKNVSRIAKLNVDIAAERDGIKRTYNEIGKLYYETHREAPEAFFVQLCQEIDLSFEHISAMETEIVRLKAEDSARGSKEPDVVVEITEEPDDAPEENDTPADSAEK